MNEMGKKNNRKENCLFVVVFFSELEEIKNWFVFEIELTPMDEFCLKKQKQIAV